MDKSDGGKGKKSDVSDGVDKVHKNILAKTYLDKTPVKSYSNYAQKWLKTLKYFSKNFWIFVDKINLKCYNVFRIKERKNTK